MKNSYSFQYLDVKKITLGRTDKVEDLHSLAKGTCGPYNNLLATESGLGTNANFNFQNSSIANANVA